MARTGSYRPRPTPQRTDARPTPLLYGYAKPSDTSGAGAPQEPIFFAELHGLYLVQSTDQSVVLIPPGYGQHDDEIPDSAETTRCWKTTEVYELLMKKAHNDPPGQEGVAISPRLLRYLGQDPWTAFPILEKPAGEQLGAFIEKHRASMYTSRPSGSIGGHEHDRITVQYLPLAYQWVLHLVSAISYLHNNGIVLGDLSDESCWVVAAATTSTTSTATAPAALSIAGFPDAAYGRVFGDSATDRPFHPLNISRPGKVRPTAQTDVFLVGCLVYQMMTGWWPGEEGPSRSVHTDAAWYGMVARWIPEGRWPTMEQEFLGDLVQMCWVGGGGGGYQDIEGVKRALVAMLKDRGLVVQGDELQGLEVDGESYT